MAETFDIAIVGGGPGGYVAAIHAAQLGSKVALIEKDKLGGTCLNRGCIPTKALVASAEAYLMAKHGEEFGVQAGPVSYNFARMMERKRLVTDQLVAGIEGLMKGNGVTVFGGMGTLINPGEVRVKSAAGEETVSAKNIILATGSVSAVVPIPGAELTINSDQILEIPQVPESLVIIGGGVIGIEFACLFAALGTKVTVIEMLPMILPPVDEEIARRFSQILRKQNVDVFTSAKVTGVSQDGNLKKVTFETTKGVQEVSTQEVLMSVGRFPYTNGLGLAEAGVEMNRRAIAVNDKMETNLKGVYAIGDVVAGIMLAHVASAEGEVAVDNALGHERQMDYTVVPSCIFSMPEIADVGLTEKQAQEQGLEFKVSKFPFSASGRAQTMGEAVGLVKMICEAGSGKILGVHIMGPHATDLIAEAALAMKVGAKADEVAETIHAHPTLPEAIMEASLGFHDRMIHWRKL